MDASNPEDTVRRGVLASGGLVGWVLGVVGFAGGSLVVRDAADVLAGAAVAGSVLVLSLAVGAWAGAPDADRAPPPLRRRWVAAAFSVAIAAAAAILSTLYGAPGATAFGRIVALIALIAAPAYTLGLLLPVLLASAERAFERLESPEDRWEPVGMLTLGVLSGAALAIALSGLLLLPRSGAVPLLLAASFLLLFPLLLPAPERTELVEEILHDVDTPLSSLRVTEVVYPGNRQPERRLYLNGEQESGELVRSGAPTLVYVAAAESWLTAGTPAGSRHLFLGGGAYTLPRRIAERDPRASVTVVELDPEVTRVAYRYFGLRRDHGIASVHGDARAYLESSSGELFDRVYVDVYTGDEAIPFHLTTVEAFTGLRRRIDPDGAMGLNLIGTTHGPESLRMWSIVRTAAEVFPALGLYTYQGLDYPDRQNVLLIGAPGADFALPPRAGLLERLPREEWPSPAGAGVLRDLLPTSADRGGAAASASRPGGAA